MIALGDLVGSPLTPIVLSLVGGALVAVASAGVRELRGVVVRLERLDGTVSSLDRRIGRIEDRVFPAKD